MRRDHLGTRCFGASVRDTGLGVLFITHNLPLVGSVAQRVAVMQAGRVVECDTTVDLFMSPREDYTMQLLSDSPSLSFLGRES
jgi:ABC-type dipeptide/oligopeptide/nickel transport system ATPase component